MYVSLITFMTTLHFYLFSAAHFSILLRDFKEQTGRSRLLCCKQRQQSLPWLNHDLAILQSNLQTGLGRQTVCFCSPRSAAADANLQTNHRHYAQMDYYLTMIYFIASPRKVRRTTVEGPYPLDLERADWLRGA